MNKMMKALAAIMLMVAMFFTAENMNAQTYNGHAYVDLGLPSGTLWATCNVGASTPEGCGDYFSWGEIKPRIISNYADYKHAVENGLIKYCSNPSYGYNGFTDNLTVLLHVDDAATSKWGNGWRTPTVDQWRELYYNTTTAWTTRNGVKGMMFTARNGNSIFLPAAGFHCGNWIAGVDEGGMYWSSSLYIYDPYCAWDFEISSDDISEKFCRRGYGLTIRPVRSAR